jgi:hypothetical protein
VPGSKTWEKQAPDSENTEGTKTSREAHKQVERRVVQGEKRPAAKFFEEDGNNKRGSRPSLEASAGNF